MSAKHTPGRWIAAPCSSVVGAPVVASPSGRSIANVTYFNLGPDFRNHDLESAANARLIAAAPDLLDALRAMLADRDDYFGADRPSTTADRARAAIALATGEA